MKKYRKIVALGIAMSVFVGTSVLTIAETTNRAANLKSDGRVVVRNEAGDKKAVIDASDLFYLANEIDSLENTYKTKTVEGLNGIGTYFQADGTKTYDAALNELTDPTLLSFEQLQSGITESQKIYNENEAFSDESGNPYYKLPSGGITTDSTEENVTEVTISPATAENLSAGSAAWVDGQLIIGTGADNKSYYNQGYAQGTADSLDKTEIFYTYHSHKDANGNVSHETSQETAGGCYTKEHTTSTPIYETCVITYEKYISGGAFWIDISHSMCGKPSTHDRYDIGGDTTGITTGTHKYQSGTNTNTVYLPDCGYSDGGVESATIIFK